MKEENEDLGPEHFEDSFLDDVEQNLSLETQIIYWMAKTWAYESGKELRQKRFMEPRQRFAGMQHSVFIWHN